MIQNRFSNSNLVARTAAFVAAATSDRNPMIGSPIRTSVASFTIQISGTGKIHVELKPTRAQRNRDPVG
jgi:hypothetical protein